METPNGHKGVYGTSGIMDIRVSMFLEAYEVLNGLKGTPHQALANKNLQRGMGF